MPAQPVKGTVMDTLTAIQNRYSCRSFTPGATPGKSEIETILKAGAAAPVGMPSAGLPHFTVIENAEFIAGLNTVAGRDMTYGAPVLIVVSCPSAPAPGLNYANAACAVTGMCIAATALGVASIYLWGPATVLANNAGLCAKAGIPAGFTALSCVALGYTAAPAPAKAFEMPAALNFVK